MLKELPIYVRGTYMLLFTGLIILALCLGEPVLFPLVMALLFAFLVLPIAKKLESWKLPRAAASLAGVLTVLLAVSMLFCFISWQILSFSDDLPDMKQAVDHKTKDLYKYVEKNYSISRKEQSKWMHEKWQESLNAGGDRMLLIFTATGTAIASMVLIPIFMFFMLQYREKFKKFLQLINPNKHEHVMEIFRKISRISQQYIRGMFIVIGILTVLSSIGFMILGLKYALLLGLIVAVLNIVPYVGVLIGSLIPVIIALVTKESGMYAVGALGVCVFVQFLENNFITPKIVGSSVNLNPLASILALLFGGIVWGLPGMILAIPLAGMFKVVCDHIEALSPLGFLLGEERAYQPINLNKLLRKRKVVREA